MSDQVQEVAALVQRIEQADQSYYNVVSQDGTPQREPTSSLTDDEYDALKDRLEQLVPDHPLVKAVGAVPNHSIWQKKRHPLPMGSLHKVKGTLGLNEWWQRLTTLVN